MATSSNHTNLLILNQFGPLKRRHLMTWFLEHQAQHSRLPQHQAFLKGLGGIAGGRLSRCILDLQTKIAFTLLHEFGPNFSQRGMYRTLIREVSRRFLQQR